MCRYRKNGIFLDISEGIKSVKMNTFAKYLTWAYWFCSSACGLVYCVLSCGFLSDNFVSCETSCEDKLRTLIYAINCGSIVTIFLVLCHIVVSTTFMYTKKRYVEALCLATSYTLSTCMIMYATIFKASIPYIYEWSFDQNNLTTKAIYIIGYILTGVYGGWVSVIILTRESNVDKETQDTIENRV